MAPVAETPLAEMPVAETLAATKVVATSKVAPTKAAAIKVEIVGDHLEAASSSSLSPTTQMRNPSNGKSTKS